MHLSVNLFKPRRECSWLADLPYLNLFDPKEEIKKVVPDGMFLFE